MCTLGALLSKMRVTLTWELQYHDNASDNLNGYQVTNRPVAYAACIHLTERVYGTEQSSRESAMCSEGHTN